MVISQAQCPEHPFSTVPTSASKQACCSVQPLITESILAFTQACRPMQLLPFGQTFPVNPSQASCPAAPSMVQHFPLLFFTHAARHVSPLAVTPSSHTTQPSSQSPS